MPLVYEYSDRSPTRAFNQATSTQTVITLSCKRYNLQDCKTERTYKYNRTATAQQYRYTSIEPFSSISTVYSSTIHPRANSPTLNPYSTIWVKSNLMSVIGISASETKASYRLLFGTQKKILWPWRIRDLCPVEDRCFGNLFEGTPTQTLACFWNASPRNQSVSAG